MSYIKRKDKLIFIGFAIILFAGLALLHILKD